MILFILLPIPGAMATAYQFGFRVSRVKTITSEYA